MPFLPISSLATIFADEDLFMSRGIHSSVGINEFKRKNKKKKKDRYEEKHVRNGIIYSNKVRGCAVLPFVLSSVFCGETAVMS